MRSYVTTQQFSIFLQTLLQNFAKNAEHYLSD